MSSSLGVRPLAGPDRGTIPLDRVKDKPQPMTTEPLTVDELFQRLVHGENCDSPIVAYPSSGSEFTYYTPQELNAHLEVAIHYYSSAIPRRCSSDDPVKVIGLL